MLLVCTVGTTVPEGVLKLQITRSRPRNDWLWVPQLAPSGELFEKYRRWYKAGEWPARARWEEYRARFLEEMEAPQARQWIKAIVEKLLQGKDVAISCFCRDERYCHRSLVAGLISDRFFEKGGDAERLGWAGYTLRHNGR
ncbi:MAG: DUF488 domain-containing protein [Bacillota bacterium]